MGEIEEGMDQEQAQPEAPSAFDSLVANFFSAVDSRVDAWFGSWFGQQNLERAPEAYKLIYRAKEDLKSRLKGE